jgi:hypothetical protein
VHSTFLLAIWKHDVLEWLMAVSVGLVVKSLVRPEKVSLKVFSSRLIGFKFGIADKSDRFAPFPLDFVTKNRTVGGKAVKKWALFRLLPLLVGDLVPADNQHWTLYLLEKSVRLSWHMSLILLGCHTWK